MRTTLTRVGILACTVSFAVYARTEYGCSAFHSTGTSFQDDNITVIENIQNNSACCEVAIAYNEKASATGMPTGKISVWWRDASLCLIKVDGKKPVARRLTASNGLPEPKAKFRFSSIYTDHMVLQAEPYKARVWGFTVADDSVSVVLDNFLPIAAQIKYIDRHNPFAPVMWSAVLPETQASTSVTHTVTVTSTKTGQKIKITDVLFGDVWVCSGQSNMAYSIAGSNGESIVHPPINNSEAEIADMHHYHSIRIFRAGKQPSPDPMLEEAPTPDGGTPNSTVQGWSEPCPDVLHGLCRVDFSAMCYLYGRNLFELTGRKVPIGLIGSYVGGTADELWSSPDALRECLDPKQPVPSSYSELWNGMIVPLLNTTIKGAIWYQGEANSHRPGGEFGGYNCTFPAMIRDWRSKWHAGTEGLTAPSFPFGFVQLDAVGDSPAYNGETDASNGDPYSTQWGYAGVRWAQTAGFGYAPNPRLPGVFMAVSVDTPDNGEKRPHDKGYNVHSPFKQPVAARLSRAALAILYGDDPVLTGPHATSAVLKGGTITVSIVGVGKEGVRIRNPTILPFDTSGFEVLRESDSVWTTVPIVGHTLNTVTLAYSGPSISKLRYLWYSNPCGYKSFGCTVYVQAERLSTLSGFHDFLPLAPFILDLHAA